MHNHPPTNSLHPANLDPVQRYLETPFDYDITDPDSITDAVHRMRDEDIALNCPGGSTYFFAAAGEGGLSMIEQAKSARNFEQRPPVTTCGFELVSQLVDFDFLAQALSQPYGEQVKDLLGMLHSSIPVVNILPVKMDVAKDFIRSLAGDVWATKIVKPLAGFNGLSTLAFPSLGHPTKRRLVEACEQAGIPAFFATSANKTGEPTISDPMLLQELFPTVPVVADPVGDRLYLEFAHPSLDETGNPHRSAYEGFGSLTAVDWTHAIDTGGYPTAVRVGSLHPDVLNELILEHSLIGNRVICPPGTKHLLPQVPTYTDLSATMQLFSSIDEMYSPLSLSAEQRRRIAPNILYKEWVEPFSPRDQAPEAIPMLPVGNYVLHQYASHVEP